MERAGRGHLQVSNLPMVHPFIKGRLSLLAHRQVRTMVFKHGSSVCGSSKGSAIAPSTMLASHVSTDKSLQFQTLAFVSLKGPSFELAAECSSSTLRCAKGPCMLQRAVRGIPEQLIYATICYDDRHSKQLFHEMKLAPSGGHAGHWRDVGRGRLNDLASVAATSIVTEVINLPFAGHQGAHSHP